MSMAIQKKILGELTESTVSIIHLFSKNEENKANNLLLLLKSKARTIPILLDHMQTELG